MRISGLGALAALLLLVAGAPAVKAEQPAAEPQAVVDGGATELARIRMALERIATLLERQAGGQRAELAMRRLDFESERALRLERQIADLAANRDALEDERFRQQQQLLALVLDAERPESAYSGADVEHLREQIDLQVQLLESRMRELDRQTQELQNQLAERREAVRGWQSVIDRHLQEE